MHGSDDLALALSRLGASGRAPEPDIRPVLLRTVVDLFLQRAVHAPAELRLFEAMVGPLLDRADPATRRAVSAKLFAHPDTPQGLLDRMVDDRMVAAADAFRTAPLDEGDLLAAATGGPVTVALMVAHRHDLSEAVVGALAGRREGEIARALAGNRAAALPRGVFAALVNRARDDRALAARLAGRAADPIEVAPLFPLLDAGQRARVIEAVRRLDLGRWDRGRPDGTVADTLSRLDQMVLRGEWDGFEHLLATALGCDEASLRPLLHDGTGDVLALCLAGAGASAEMAARAFILGDPAVGHSVAAVRRLTRLVDVVPPGSARRLVGAMVGGDAPQPGPRRPIVTPTKPVSAPLRRAEPAEAPARNRDAADPNRRRRSTNS